MAESVAAWAEFCRALEKAGEVVLRDAAPDTPLDRAEGVSDAYTRVRIYWSVARLAEAEGRPLSTEPPRHPAARHEGQPAARRGPDQVSPS